MSIRMNKTFAAAVTALTLIATLAMASTDAQAKGWGKGWGGKGFGIGVGLLAAAAITSAYVAPAYACERVPMYDRFGNYIGSRRVCADD